MGLGLFDYQLEAISHMKNGCILCGGTGSGKSRAALGYYYKENGGDIYGNDHSSDRKITMQDLYIITPAKKRDSKEWLGEMMPFCLSTDKTYDIHNHKVVIDSWNNIQKYEGIYGAFFIFDEQRVGGHGVWAETFLKITKRNKWILLSATPGDTWDDYITVFIANGFYKNKYQFDYNHVIRSPFVKYRKVERYFNEGVLIKHRDELLVDMNFQRHTKRHYEIIQCDYDAAKYKSLIKTRWDPYENEPIENGSKLYHLQVRVSNSSDDRQAKLLEILEDHPKVIIFYNYDYELDALRTLLEASKMPFNEWNGHKHEPLPSGEKWAYLVQYSAGNEAWNCTETDTIIFYSQNPSYKVLEQASGRIDRANTPFVDLYYYRLMSSSPIDRRINIALKNKKNFNTKNLVRKYNETYFTEVTKPSADKLIDIQSDPLPESFYETKEKVEQLKLF